MDRPARRPALRAVAALPLAVALRNAGRSLRGAVRPATALAAFAGGARAGAQDVPQPEKQPIMAGPYVPSPDTVVSQMLEMAGVGPDDVLIDLGSGDGRIVLTAATLRGARGLGVEIQEKLVAASIEAAARAGVADRARFARQDLFTTDVSRATVVTIYLLPETVNLLRDKLQHELRPGTRVISHDYPISGWLPESWKRLDEPEKKGVTGQPSATVYLYRVPAQVGGRWAAPLPAELGRARVVLALRQQWQMLDGMATVAGREVPLEEVRLSGERVAFRLSLERGRAAVFEGVAAGDAIEGALQVHRGPALPWRVTRLG
ncbi:MAG: hypothetical protein RJA99_1537 [Pseudomonadota bacterium]|jgi:hypothetical protein